MAFGVNVGERTAPGVRGSTSDTGTLYLVGPTAGEFATVGELFSRDDFEAIWGGRVGASIQSWDAVDAFFREAADGARLVFAPYDSDYGDGLALIDKPSDWRLAGPGQLAVIGVTPSGTVYTDQQSASENNNRRALRDVGDEDTVAQMIAKGALAPENDDLGATFGPWCVVQAPAGVLGAGPRVVPASVVIAALCSRVDQLGNPNRAAAGDDFALSSFVTGFAADVSDQDRTNLFAAGVNAFANVYGTLENFGFQTNRAESNDDPYWQFNCSRGRMYLKYRAQLRGQPYMFQPIDGKGREAGALQGDMAAECKALYQADGLYSEDGTGHDAYSVAVNETISDVAQGALKVSASVVWTMHTKEVDIDLVTVPIGASVSG